MDLSGDWIAARNGMPGTRLAMTGSGEIAQARTQAELLAAIGDILTAGRATGEPREWGFASGSWPAVPAASARR